MTKRIKGASGFRSMKWLTPHSEAAYNHLMGFLTLLAIALVPAGLGKLFFSGITWKEFALHLGVQTVVAGASAGIIYYKDTSDVEAINGVVTKKEQLRVSCGHSYDCNCRSERSCSGFGKNRSCTSRRVCDTCYEHSYDYDWRVYSSVGTWNIRRVDSQGRREPDRFTSTRVGEPVSTHHTFRNYIKAAPGTLFKTQGTGKKYAGRIPKYPDEIYDYWHLNRFVQAGIKVPDASQWVTGIEALNGELGPSKQVNLIVVVTTYPEDYFFALREAWVGGKKNDAILVIGVNKNLDILWVEVMAWTVTQDFEVFTRGEISQLRNLDRKKVLTALRAQTMRRYKRKPMHDFEYLAASITPTPMELFVAGIIGFLISIGLVYVFHRYDVFGEESRRHRW